MQLHAAAAGTAVPTTAADATAATAATAAAATDAATDADARTTAATAVGSGHRLPDAHPAAYQGRAAANAQVSWGRSSATQCPSVHRHQHRDSWTGAALVAPCCLLQPSLTVLLLFLLACPTHTHTDTWSCCAKGRSIGSWTGATPAGCCNTRTSQTAGTGGLRTTLHQRVSRCRPGPRSGQGAARAAAGVGEGVGEAEVAGVVVAAREGGKRVCRGQQQSTRRMIKNCQWLSVVTSLSNHLAAWTGGRQVGGSDQISWVQ